MNADLGHMVLEPRTGRGGQRHALLVCGSCSDPSRPLSARSNTDDGLNKSVHVCHDSLSFDAIPSQFHSLSHRSFVAAL